MSSASSSSRHNVSEIESLLASTQIESPMTTETEPGKGENLMQGWRKMRQEQPDLFKNVVVSQQPAARVDAVLCHWVRGARGESEVVRGSK